MKKEEFVQKAWAAAQASSAVSGLPAEITVGQAALESGFGRSRLSIEANNFFGIKARTGEPAVEMKTAEVIGGVRKEITARFRKFASMEECFAARDTMILHLPCYAEARANAGDVEKFVAALAKRWATDPEYAGKVLRISSQLPVASR